MSTQSESKKEQGASPAPVISQKPAKKLQRSKSDQVVAGVCAGIAKYFDIDPVVVRIIFALVTIGGGTGILLYILLWIIMPEEESTAQTTEETIKENAEEIKDKAEVFAKEVTAIAEGQKKNTALWGGIILMGLGVYFLFGNLGLFDIFRFLRFEVIWPLILVFAGIILSKPERV